jgi:hypothetical protein
MLETILVVLILFLILMWIVGQKLKRHIAEVEAQVITEVKELFDVPPLNPPIETSCDVLTEPLTALYKLPNDKFVLAIV